MYTYYIYIYIISEKIECLGLFIVEDIFVTTKTVFFILPELSVTFPVNFFKGEIYFITHSFILSSTYILLSLIGQPTIVI